MHNAFRAFDGTDPGPPSSQPIIEVVASGTPGTPSSPAGSGGLTPPGGPFGVPPSNLLREGPDASMAAQDALMSQTVAHFDSIRGSISGSLLIADTTLALNGSHLAALEVRLPSASASSLDAPALSFGPLSPSPLSSAGSPNGGRARRRRLGVLLRESPAEQKKLLLMTPAARKQLRREQSVGARNQLLGLLADLPAHPPTDTPDTSGATPLSIDQRRSERSAVSVENQSAPHVTRRPLRLFCEAPTPAEIEKAPPEPSRPRPGDNEGVDTDGPLSAAPVAGEAKGSGTTEVTTPLSEGAAPRSRLTGASCRLVEEASDSPVAVLVDCASLQPAVSLLGPEDHAQRRLQLERVAAKRVAGSAILRFEEAVVSGAVVDKLVGVPEPVKSNHPSRPASGVAGPPAPTSLAELLCDHLSSSSDEGALDDPDAMAAVASTLGAGERGVELLEGAVDAYTKLAKGAKAARRRRSTAAIDPAAEKERMKNAAWLFGEELQTAQALHQRRVQHQRAQLMESVLLRRAERTRLERRGTDRPRWYSRAPIYSAAVLTLFNMPHVDKEEYRRKPFLVPLSVDPPLRPRPWHPYPPFDGCFLDHPRFPWSSTNRLQRHESSSWFGGRSDSPMPLTGRTSVASDVFMPQSARTFESDKGGHAATTPRRDPHYSFSRAAATPQAGALRSWLLRPSAISATTDFGAVVPAAQHYNAAFPAPAPPAPFPTSDDPLQSSISVAHSSSIFGARSGPLSMTSMSSADGASGSISPTAAGLVGPADGSLAYLFERWAQALRADCGRYTDPIAVQRTYRLWCREHEAGEQAMLWVVRRLLAWVHRCRWGAFRLTVLRARLLLCTLQPASELGMRLLPPGNNLSSSQAVPSNASFSAAWPPSASVRASTQGRPMGLVLPPPVGPFAVLPSGAVSGLRVWAEHVALQCQRALRSAITPAPQPTPHRVEAESDDEDDSDQSTPFRTDASIFSHGFLPPLRATQHAAHDAAFAILSEPIAPPHVSDDPNIEPPPLTVRGLVAERFVDLLLELDVLLQDKKAAVAEEEAQRRVLAAGSQSTIAMAASVVTAARRLNSRGGSTSNPTAAQQQQGKDLAAQSSLRTFGEGASIGIVMRRGYSVEERERANPLGAVLHEVLVRLQRFLVQHVLSLSTADLLSNTASSPASPHSSGAAQQTVFGLVSMRQVLTDVFAHRPPDEAASSAQILDRLQARLAAPHGKGSSKGAGPSTAAASATGNRRAQTTNMKSSATQKTSSKGKSDASKHKTAVDKKKGAVGENKKNKKSKGATMRAVSPLQVTALEETTVLTVPEAAVTGSAGALPPPPREADDLHNLAPLRLTAAHVAAWAPMIASNGSEGHGLLGTTFALSRQQRGPAGGGKSTAHAAPLARLLGRVSSRGAKDETKFAFQRTYDDAATAVLGRREGAVTHADVVGIVADMFDTVAAALEATEIGATGPQATRRSSRGASFISLHSKRPSVDSLLESRDYSSGSEGDTKSEGSQSKSRGGADSAADDDTAIIPARKFTQAMQALLDRCTRRALSMTLALLATAMHPANDAPSAKLPTSAREADVPVSVLEPCFMHTSAAAVRSLARTTNKTADGRPQEAPSMAAALPGWFWLCDSLDVISDLWCLARPDQASDAQAGAPSSSPHTPSIALPASLRSLASLSQTTLYRGGLLERLPISCIGAWFTPSVTEYNVIPPDALLPLADSDARTLAELFHCDGDGSSDRAGGGSFFGGSRSRQGSVMGSQSAGGFGSMRRAPSSVNVAAQPSWREGVRKGHFMATMLHVLDMAYADVAFSWATETSRTGDGLRPLDPDIIPALPPYHPEAGADPALESLSCAQEALVVQGFTEALATANPALVLRAPFADRAKFGAGAVAVVSMDVCLSADHYAGDLLRVALTMFEAKMHAELLAEALQALRESFQARFQSASEAYMRVQRRTGTAGTAEGDLARIADVDALLQEAPSEVECRMVLEWLWRSEFLHGQVPPERNPDSVGGPVHRAPTSRRCTECRKEIGLHCFTHMAQPTRVPVLEANGTQRCIIVEGPRPSELLRRYGRDILLDVDHNIFPISVPETMAASEDLHICGECIPRYLARYVGGALTATAKERKATKEAAAQAAAAAKREKERQEAASNKLKNDLSEREAARVARVERKKQERAARMEAWDAHLAKVMAAGPAMPEIAPNGGQSSPTTDGEELSFRNADALFSARGGVGPLADALNATIRLDDLFPSDDSEDDAALDEHLHSPLIGDLLAEGPDSGGLGTDDWARITALVKRRQQAQRQRHNRALLQTLSGGVDSEAYRRLAEELGDDVSLGGSFARDGDDSDPQAGRLPKRKGNRNQRTKSVAPLKGTSGQGQFPMSAGESGSDSTNPTGLHTGFHPAGGGPLSDVEVNGESFMAASLALLHESDLLDVSASTLGSSVLGSPTHKSPRHGAQPSAATSPSVSPRPALGAPAAGGAAAQAMSLEELFRRAHTEQRNRGALMRLMEEETETRAMIRREELGRYVNVRMAFTAAVEREQQRLADQVEAIIAASMRRSTPATSSRGASRESNATGAPDGHGLNAPRSPCESELSWSMSSADALGASEAMAREVDDSEGAGAEAALLTEIRSLEADIARRVISGEGTSEEVVELRARLRALQEARGGGPTSPPRRTSKATTVAAAALSSPAQDGEDDESADASVRRRRGRQQSVRWAPRLEERRASLKSARLGKSPSKGSLPPRSPKQQQWGDTSDGTASTASEAVTSPKGQRGSTGRDRHDLLRRSVVGTLTMADMTAIRRGSQGAAPGPDAVGGLVTAAANEGSKGQSQQPIAHFNDVTAFHSSSDSASSAGSDGPFGIRAWLQNGAVGETLPVAAETVEFDPNTLKHLLRDDYGESVNAASAEELPLEVQGSSLLTGDALERLGVRRRKVSLLDALEGSGSGLVGGDERGSEHGSRRPGGAEHLVITGTSRRRSELASLPRRRLSATDQNTPSDEELEPPVFGPETRPRMGLPSVDGRGVSVPPDGALRTPTTRRLSASDSVASYRSRNRNRRPNAASGDADGAALDGTTASAHSSPTSEELFAGRADEIARRAAMLLGYDDDAAPLSYIGLMEAAIRAVAVRRCEVERASSRRRHSASRPGAGPAVTASVLALPDTPEVQSYEKRVQRQLRRARGPVHAADAYGPAEVHALLISPLLFIMPPDGVIGTLQESTSMAAAPRHDAPSLTSPGSFAPATPAGSGYQLMALDDVDAMSASTYEPRRLGPAALKGSRPPETRTAAGPSAKRQGIVTAMASSVQRFRDAEHEAQSKKPPEPPRDDLARRARSPLSPAKAAKGSPGPRPTASSTPDKDVAIAVRRGMDTHLRSPASSSFYGLGTSPSFVLEREKEKPASTKLLEKIWTLLGARHETGVASRGSSRRASRRMSSSAGLPSDSSRGGGLATAPEGDDCLHYHTTMFTEQCVLHGLLAAQHLLPSQGAAQGDAVAHVAGYPQEAFLGPPPPAGSVGPANAVPMLAAVHAFGSLSSYTSLLHQHGVHIIPPSTQTVGLRPPEAGSELVTTHNGRAFAVAVAGRAASLLPQTIFEALHGSLLGSTAGFVRDTTAGGGSGALQGRMSMKNSSTAVRCFRTMHMLLKACWVACRRRFGTNAARVVGDLIAIGEGSALSTDPDRFGATLRGRDPRPAFWEARQLLLCLYVARQWQVVGSLAGAHPLAPTAFRVGSFLDTEAAPSLAEAVLRCARRHLRLGVTRITTTQRDREVRRGRPPPDLKVLRWRVYLRLALNDRRALFERLHAARSQAMHLPPLSDDLCSDAPRIDVEQYLAAHRDRLLNEDMSLLQDDAEDLLTAIEPMLPAYRAAMWARNALAAAAQMRADVETVHRTLHLPTSLAALDAARCADATVRGRLLAGATAFVTASEGTVQPIDTLATLGRAAVALARLGPCREAAAVLQMAGVTTPFQSFGPADLLPLLPWPRWFYGADGVAEVLVGVPADLPALAKTDEGIRGALHTALRSAAVLEEVPNLDRRAWPLPELWRCFVCDRNTMRIAHRRTAQEQHRRSDAPATRSAQGLRVRTEKAGTVCLGALAAAVVAHEEVLACEPSAAEALSQTLRDASTAQRIVESKLDSVLEVLGGGPGDVAASAGPGRVLEAVWGLQLIALVCGHPLASNGAAVEPQHTQWGLTVATAPLSPVLRRAAEAIVSAALGSDTAAAAGSAGPGALPPSALVLLQCAVDGLRRVQDEVLRFGVLPTLLPLPSFESCFAALGSSTAVHAYLDELVGGGVTLKELHRREVLRKAVQRHAEDVEGFVAEAFATGADTVIDDWPEHATGIAAGALQVLPARARSPAGAPDSPAVSDLLDATIILDALAAGDWCRLSPYGGLRRRIPVSITNYEGPAHRERHLQWLAEQGHRVISGANDPSGSLQPEEDNDGNTRGIVWQPADARVSSAASVRAEAAEGRRREALERRLNQLKAARLALVSEAIASKDGPADEGRAGAPRLFKFPLAARTAPEAGPNGWIPPRIALRRLPPLSPQLGHRASLVADRAAAGTGPTERQRALQRLVDTATTAPSRRGSGFCQTPPPRLTPVGHQLPSALSSGPATPSPGTNRRGSLTDDSGPDSGLLSTRSTRRPSLQGQGAAPILPPTRAQTRAMDVLREARILLLDMQINDLQKRGGNERR